MTPNRGDRQEFRVGHVGDFELAVLGREVEVGLAGHHIGLCLDGSQSLLEIAVMELVVADIAVLPGPQHGQKVVGVLRQEASFGRKKPSQKATRKSSSEE